MISSAHMQYLPTNISHLKQFIHENVYHICSRNRYRIPCIRRHVANTFYHLYTYSAIHFIHRRPCGREYMHAIPLFYFTNVQLFI